MIGVPNERLRTSPGSFSLGFKDLRQTPILTSVKKNKTTKNLHATEPVNPAKKQYETKDLITMND
jgi:hypothetical protein